MPLGLSLAGARLVGARLVGDLLLKVCPATDALVMGLVVRRVGVRGAVDAVELAVLPSRLPLVGGLKVAYLIQVSRSGLLGLVRCPVWSRWLGWWGLIRGC